MPNSLYHLLLLLPDRWSKEAEMEARTAATYPTAAAAGAATAAAIAATAAATLPGEQRRRSSEAAAHRERSPALENMRRLTAAAKALGPLLPRRF